MSEGRQLAWPVVRPGAVFHADQPEAGRKLREEVKQLESPHRLAQDDRSVTTEARSAEKTISAQFLS